MAKISGPLASLDARGNWGKGALQFRGGLRGTHAYRPPPPGSINQASASTAQAQVREAYRLTLAGWRNLSEEEQTQWDANAQEKSLSGWNLYLKTYLPGWLEQPELPPPNTYTAPAGDAVIFPGTNWVQDDGYTPPDGDAVTFPINT